jgi:putative membrane protein
VGLKRSLAAVIDPGTTVVLFLAGGVVGLVTIARVVRIALARNRELTLVFLVSLIAGSVPAPLHNIAETHAWTTETIALTAAWAALGAIALFALEYLVGGFNPE